MRLGSLERRTHARVVHLLLHAVQQVEQLGAQLRAQQALGHGHERAPPAQRDGRGGSVGESLEVLLYRVLQAYRVDEEQLVEPLHLLRHQALRLQLRPPEPHPRQPLQRHEPPPLV